MQQGPCFVLIKNHRIALNPACITSRGGAGRCAIPPVRVTDRTGLIKMRISAGPFFQIIHRNETIIPYLFLFIKRWVYTL